MRERAAAGNAARIRLGIDPANVDQKNIPGSTDKSAPAEVLLAQTFTAGKTGMLVEVDVYIAGEGEPSATVEIRATDRTTGLSSGGPLATSSASLPIDFTWLHLIFTPPLGVTSGTKYAIILISNDETLVATPTTSTSVERPCSTPELGRTHR